MKKGCLLLILSVLLICACGNKPNKENQGLMEGEETMPVEIAKEEFVSKERFLEYIKTKDVGLSIKDFEVVEIEEFIAKWRLTEENMENTISRMVDGEYHLYDLEQWEKTRYMAREKFSVDSSDKEYREFINTYSQIIDMEIKISEELPLGSGFISFEIEEDGKKTTLYIDQTKNLFKHEFVELPNMYPQLLNIVVWYGSSGSSAISPFCYSKNKKYFMATTYYTEKQLELIKKFQEIDD
ncbi:MAG: hypothetical protein FWC09_05110 [Lachnospiraceae bacterium]|nr:hypothetical protein [Lachnospiraceae bacterium]